MILGVIHKVGTLKFCNFWPSPRRPPPLLYLLCTCFTPYDTMLKVKLPKTWLFMRTKRTADTWRTNKIIFSFQTPSFYFNINFTENELQSYRSWGKLKQLFSPQYVVSCSSASDEVTQNAWLQLEPWTHWQENIWSFF